MTQLSFDDWGDSKAASPQARRVFLGWQDPPLANATEWLIEAHGDALGDLLVALPGARAARRLQERLARRASPSWSPPRILTQGELTDALVQLEQPTAGRLVRTLAWERGLAKLAPEESQRLSRANVDDAGIRRRATRRERMRLAETVRSLHGELAPEGADFASVIRGRTRPEIESECERWETLSKVQRAYRALLARVGLSDPHDARRRAIREGRIERSSPIVLIGVADMNELLAELLETVQEQVTALIVAPAEEAEGFDGLGRLRTPFWRSRDLALDRSRWHVRERPVDQADAVCEVLTGWNGRFSADEVRIGIADEQVVPYLERRLTDAGARARHAAGTPLAASRPYRLLRAVGGYLSRGGFSELAALARDPDLTASLGLSNATERLDAYFVEHLPKSGRGDWIEDPERPRDTRAVRRLQKRIDRALGPLAGETSKLLCAWAQPLRAFLGSVYDQPLDPEVEAERQLAESLRSLGAVLGELEDLPQEIAGEPVEAGTALELVLRSLRLERIAPMPARPGESVVELYGWLDLPLDDAPALIVTGFNEGRVPQSTHSHPFLPDGVRRRLGLPSDDDRAARDAYLAAVLLGGEREWAFVTGRRSQEGDPLVPSRLAFHAQEDEVVRRVRHFLGEQEEALSVPERQTALVEPEARFACPRFDDWEPPARISVSSFRTWLESPYRFFIERVLRLRTIDDRARELDPLRFGSLTHEVLQVFGESGPTDSEDPIEIEAFLRATLDSLLSARFGHDPLPAIALQGEQLKHRLEIFSRRQADWRGAGWRIHQVEWSPPEGAAFLEVDGSRQELSGRIDRVDVHDDGRWAILDYKSGDDQKDPEAVHRRGGKWVDLQLPLYGILGASLGLPGEPLLGYVTVGKDSGETRFRLADWTREELEEAQERARDVVREVRAGAFWTPGRTPWDAVLQALWGEGMFAAPSVEAEA